MTFYRWTGVKVAAIILLVLLAGFLLANGSMVLFWVEQDAYSVAVDSYYDTSMCHSTTWSYADNIWEIYNHIADNTEEKDVAKTIDERLFNGQDTNLTYRMLRKDETQAFASVREPAEQDRPFSFEFGDYTIQCFVRNPISAKDNFYEGYQVFQRMYPQRYLLLWLLVGGLIMFVVDAVILLLGAGRRPGEQEVILNLQDRIPLDLYLAAAALAFSLPIMVLANYTWNSLMELIIAGVMVLAAFCVLIPVILTLATRFKAGGWWRNSLVWQLLRLLGRITAFFWALAQRIPLVWKSVLIFGCVSLASLLLLCEAFSVGNGLALLGWFLLELLLGAGVILVSLGLRELKNTGAFLAAGDFDHKANTRWLYLDLLEHGNHLNSIGEGMAAAVAQRMRSERLKTELITNVSHDIKTPLTSIVNYVDLLEKENLPGTSGEYVEVLTRQAGRLKKLTEDLVDASKASTGNLTVDLERIDLRELAEQAAGEYQEKLELLRLELVSSFPEGDIHVRADGKHLWRVLDNLLGNICKYTLPGTRVYLDVTQASDKAVLTLKNISNTRLNVDAEELIERFVQGDSSRASDGSGLGLHIARSLVELQDGTLDLSVDGDLFKAIIHLHSWE